MANNHSLNVDSGQHFTIKAGYLNNDIDVYALPGSIQLTDLPSVDIVYDYHWHDALSNARTKTEKQTNIPRTMLTAGGCYTKAHPHVHSGNTDSGGACYQSSYICQGTHYEEKNCFGECEDGYPGPGACGSNIYCTGCDFHACFAGHWSYWEEQEAKNSICGRRIYTLTCSKTVDYYELACGWSDNAIVQAHVVFKKN